jgi:hypothetical protein
MMRTTQSELDSLARSIADATGRQVSIGWAYGRPRLEERGGYRELTGRHPSGVLADIMRGMLQGIRLATPHAARPEWRNSTLVHRCQTCGHPIHHRGPLTPPEDGYGCDHWRHNPRRAPIE